MEQAVVVTEVSVVKVTDAWYGIIVNLRFHIAESARDFLQLPSTLKSFQAQSQGIAND
jgi:hypothetical protein